MGRRELRRLERQGTCRERRRGEWQSRNKVRKARLRRRHGNSLFASRRSAADKPRADGVESPRGRHGVVPGHGQRRLRRLRGAVRIVQGGGHQAGPRPVASCHGEASGRDIPHDDGGQRSRLHRPRGQVCRRRKVCRLLSRRPRRIRPVRRKHDAVARDARGEGHPDAVRERHRAAALPRGASRSRESRQGAFREAWTLHLAVASRGRTEIPRAEGLVQPNEVSRLRILPHRRGLARLGRRRGAVGETEGVHRLRQFHRRKDVHLGELQRDDEP